MSILRNIGHNVLSFPLICFHHVNIITQSERYKLAMFHPSHCIVLYVPHFFSIRIDDFNLLHTVGFSLALGLGSAMFGALTLLYYPIQMVACQFSV